MQRKILNIKKAWSEAYIQNGQEKLHSIPILLNMKKSISRNNNSKKSNVLYSIPCGCVFALLLVGAFTLAIDASETYAIAWCAGTDEADCTRDGLASNYDSAVTPVSGGTSTPATASLSLSNSNMTSSAVTPGSTAIVSTNVTVSVSDAESYSLSVKVDNANLTNGSTTITPGNVITDNTWGYKWDNASTYTAPSTSGATLTNSTTMPLNSNGAVSFTKNLTFGAKFSSSAEAGHYKGSGTLSLVATPKAAVVITLADLTQMQQLADGYAPDACANTPYLDGQTYSAEYTLTDVRGNETYTVRKFGDGKCWMTQNLRLSNYYQTWYYSQGRKLNPTTSDVTTEWTLPAQSKTGFSSNTASNTYLSGSTAYYTWCAATAGTCSSATSNGANASSSICPKGWKLPTGSSGGEFEAFANAEGITSDATGSTKIRGAPYNFAYTGQILSGSLNAASIYGYWWSSTAYDSAYAYNLFTNSSGVTPGTDISRRFSGLAVRCVAE